MSVSPQSPLLLVTALIRILILLHHFCDVLFVVAIVICLLFFLFLFFFSVLEIKFRALVILTNLYPYSPAHSSLLLNILFHLFKYTKWVCHQETRKQ